MGVSRARIEAELQGAERALEEAVERRRAAESALWVSVSQSGRSEVAVDELLATREAYAEAERERVDAEAFVADLREQLAEAREREGRLLAVTDMLLARDQARRHTNGSSASPSDQIGGDQPKVAHRSLLDRLRRR